MSKRPKYLNEGDLDKLAARLRAGESYEAILADIDGVCGTAMPERDAGAEAAFEARRGLTSLGDEG